MSEAVAVAVAPKQGALPDCPYVGLVPFQEADADFFFGRERDTLVITANLETARLTLLYGASGVGKSSVLDAGAVHRLRESSHELPTPAGRPGCVAVVFRSWRDDPVAGLASAVRDAVRSELGIEVPTSGSLLETLEACEAQYEGEILVVLDQFEEYFVYQHGDVAESRFASQLTEAIKRTDLRVHFLVSMREDALARLDLFKGRIPGLFENRLRVEHLALDAGREAIERPVEEWNDRALASDRVSIEPGLVDAVLGQVRGGRVQAGRAGIGEVKGTGRDERIEAAYLQLVMMRLWDEERAAGSRTLRLPTLERLGGAASIVRAHLDRAVESLSDGEQDIAARIFDHLVTPSGTKIAHAIPDLAKYAKIGEAELTPVLEKLSAARILRPVSAPDGGPTRYEIFHDVLAASILEWRARYVQEQERTAADLEQRRRRRRRVIRALAVLVLLGLVVIAALAAVALNQRSSARNERDRARDAEANALEQKRLAVAAQHVAGSRELAATSAAQLAADPDLALVLAVDAHHEAATQEARQALLDALRETQAGVTLRGHKAAVRDGAFSPDGTRVVTASADNTAQIWDATSGRSFATLKHDDAVSAAVFSPDGSLVATSSDDRTARIWRADTGQPVATLEHAGPVRSVAFSSDGVHLATASADGSARVWDLSSPDRPVAQLDNVRPGSRSPTPVMFVAFDASGNRVAVTGVGGTAWLWEWSTGAKHFLGGHKGTVWDAAFSPGGAKLVTAGDDGTARLWNGRTGEARFVLKGHERAVRAVAFTPDGGYVVSGSADGTLRIWDAEFGGHALQVLRGHTGAVLRVAVTGGSPALIVSASADASARVWLFDKDLEQAALLTDLRGQRGALYGVAISADGTTVLTASADATARLWKITRPGEVGVFPESGRGPSELWAAALDSNERHLATGAMNGDVIVWDVSSGESQRLPFGYSSTVRTVTYSPDGRYLLSASFDGTAVVWDLAQARAIARLQTRKDPSGLREQVSGAAFSPDGRNVVTVSLGVGDTSEVRVWSLDAPDQPARSFETQDRLTSVAFAPDGARIVTGTVDDLAVIWDVETGSRLTVLRGHSGVVESVQYSADGARVLTSSLDGTARLWDARSGREVGVLAASTTEAADGLLSASFSADGRRVVTGGFVGIARVWDSATQREIEVIPVARGAIYEVAFDRASRLVLTANADGTARVFRCYLCGSVPELLKLADGRIAASGRTLTPDERRRYLHATG